MLKVELPAVWLDVVQQQIFRQLLSCISFPGTIADLSNYLQGSNALIGVLATLLDNTVTLHDAHGLIEHGDTRSVGANAYRRFISSPIVPVSEARFIIADGAIPADADIVPNLGTLDSPEFGATVILQGEEIGSGELTLNLSGPGISSKNQKPNQLLVKGFHQDWFIRRQQWVSDFPLGIDMVLVDNTKVVMIPRTTRVIFDF